MTVAYERSANLTWSIPSRRYASRSIMASMPKITLIAHNIRSTHNVGAIFRTAEGFGVAKIILSGYTPYPAYRGDKRLPHEAAKISAQIHKTALDAESLVPFEVVDNLGDWLDQQSEPLYALEQSPDSLPIGQFKPDSDYLLLLGEEVNGVEASLLKRCQAVLEIPMVGQKESFNVSIATGIALYALTY